MKMQTLIAGVALVVALTVMSGAIHGRLNQRWGPSGNVEAAAELLHQWPEAFGDWELEAA